MRAAMQEERNTVSCNGRMRLCLESLYADDGATPAAAPKPPLQLPRLRAYRAGDGVPRAAGLPRRHHQRPGRRPRLPGVGGAAGAAAGALRVRRVQQGRGAGDHLVLVLSRGHAEQDFLG